MMNCVLYLQTINMGITILVWSVILALAVAFVGTLLVKWNTIMWLQLHAPSDLMHKMFTCRFCMSWWMSIAFSLSAIIQNGIEFILIPVCATIIASRLW